MPLIPVSEAAAASTASWGEKTEEDVLEEARIPRALPSSHSSGLAPPPTPPSHHTSPPQPPAAAPVPPPSSTGGAVPRSSSPAPSLLSSLSEDGSRPRSHEDTTTRQASGSQGSKGLVMGGGVVGSEAGSGSEEEQRLKDTRRAILEAFASGDGRLSKLAHEARQAIPEGGHSRRETEFSLHGIRGALDGVLVSLSIVGAAHGAQLAREVLLCVGVSSMAALALGVGLAHYRADREDLHYYQRERKREEWEMDNFLAGERREMVELYMGRGLVEEDATLVIDTLLQYKHVFLDHMMVMELGLMPLDKDLSRAKGVVALCSLLSLGGLPLLPYVCWRPSAVSPPLGLLFLGACLLGALALTLLGVVKARLMGQKLPAACGWMVLMGLVTTSVAWGVGRGTQRLLL